MKGRIYAFVCMQGPVRH